MTVTENTNSTVFLLQAATYVLLIVYFLKRFVVHGFFRYMTKEYILGLNMRSYAILLFQSYLAMGLVGCACVGCAKLFNWYFLNIFTQKVEPALVLFYGGPSLLQYLFGVTLLIASDGTRFVAGAVAIALLLPTSIRYLQQKIQMVSIMSYAKYRILLIYGVIRWLLGFVFIRYSTYPIGTFDPGDFLAMCFSAADCLFLGYNFRSIAKNLQSLSEETQPSGCATEPATLFEDLVLVDLDLKDSPIIRLKHLSSVVAYTSTALLCQGFCLCLSLVLSSADSSSSLFTQPRDLATFLSLVAWSVGTFGIGIILMPHKKFEITLDETDAPRPTAIESVFWKPVIFLMDREHRPHIRMQRERRIAAAAAHLGT